MEVDAGEPTRVQSLARLGAAAVPCQYIQPPETRPTKNVHHKINKNNSTSGPSPPLIDLGGNGDASSIREAVGSACTGWGAFQVINHGVPVELLHRMRRVGKDFFGEFDMEMKLKYACDPNFPASEGYGSRMLVASNEAVLDWRDYFDHHTLPATRRNPARWPHLPTNYRGTVSEYSDSIEVLARKVLCLISESLGMSSSAIEEAVGEFYQNITISYYPPCPQPELTLGLQSHSDMGAITLLIQDEVEGLQVLKDDEWVMVPPLPEAILVLIADQTEIITNGRYTSCQHRAITNSKRARLSVATFHDPARSRKISPAFDPPKYREVVYGDFVSSWYSKGPEGKRNIDALLL